MAHRTIPLKHIYPKDRRAMGVLAKSGACSRDTFNKLDISNNRVKSYQQANLIKEVYVPDKHGTDGSTYYELTQKGEIFCKQECQIDKFISNGHAASHNAKVAECLSSLSKKEIDSAISERDIREEFLSERLQEMINQNERDEYEELLEAIQNQSLSMPDIIYKSEAGTYEAIEVITDAYGKDEIQSKIETCEKMGISIEIVHT